MDLFIGRYLCPICESSKLKVLITRNLFNKDFLSFIELEPTYKDAFYYDLGNGILENQIFEVVKCLKCKFIFQKYVLNEYGMNKLYNTWMDHTTVQSISHHPMQNKYYLDRINYIKKHFRNRKINILDWGAGLGYFCLVAKSSGNLNVYAYDYSSEKSNHLVQHGVKTLSLSELPNKYFHFINIDQVLEHVSDPLLLLKNILNYLSNDGIIYISVPLCNTIENQLKRNKLDLKTFRQLQPHQHINAFTNKSLKNIAKKAGLSPYFEPTMQIIPSFNNCISLNEYVKNSIRPFYRQWFSTSLYFERTKSI